MYNGSVAHYHCDIAHSYEGANAVLCNDIMCRPTWRLVAKLLYQSRLLVGFVECRRPVGASADSEQTEGTSHRTHIDNP